MELTTVALFDLKFVESFHILTGLNFNLNLASEDHENKIIVTNQGLYRMLLCSFRV